MKADTTKKKIFISFIIVIFFAIVSVLYYNFFPVMVELEAIGTLSEQELKEFVTETDGQFLDGDELEMRYSFGEWQEVTIDNAYFYEPIIDRFLQKYLKEHVEYSKHSYIYSYGRPIEKMKYQRYTVEKYEFLDKTKIAYEGNVRYRNVPEKAGLHVYRILDDELHFINIEEATELDMNIP